MVTDGIECAIWEQTPTGETFLTVGDISDKCITSVELWGENAYYQAYIFIFTFIFHVMRSSCYKKLKMHQKLKMPDFLLWVILFKMCEIQTSFVLKISNKIDIL